MEVIIKTEVRGALLKSNSSTKKRMWELKSNKEKQEIDITEQLGPLTDTYEDETSSSLCGLY